MATQDARIGAWSLNVTAGAARAFRMTWRDDEGPYDLTDHTVTLTVGDTEYEAEVASNVATIVLPAQTTSAKMRLYLDGALMAVGNLYVDHRGSTNPVTEVAVTVAPLSFTVQVIGPPGPAGPTPELVEDPPGSGLYTLGVN